MEGGEDAGEDVAEGDQDDMFLSLSLGCIVIGEDLVVVVLVVVTVFILGLSEMLEGDSME